MNDWVLDSRTGYVVNVRTGQVVPQQQLAAGGIVQIFGGFVGHPGGSGGFFGGMNPHAGLGAVANAITEIAEHTHSLPTAAQDTPIIAYRAWKFSGTRLYAVHSGSHAWPVRKPFAGYCNSLPHDAPQAMCKCGIYAFKTTDIMAREIANEGATIYGRVALWGKVIEHKDGYRAEFAYPQLLYYPQGDDAARAAVEKAAQLYGIECAPAPDDMRPLYETPKPEMLDPQAAYAALMNAMGAQSQQNHQAYLQQMLGQQNHAQALLQSWQPGAIISVDPAMDLEPWPLPLRSLVFSLMAGGGFGLLYCLYLLGRALFHHG